MVDEELFEAVEFSDALACAVFRIDIFPVSVFCSRGQSFRREQNAASPQTTDVALLADRRAKKDIPLSPYVCRSAYAFSIPHFDFRRDKATELEVSRKNLRCPRTPSMG